MPTVGEVGKELLRSGVLKLGFKALTVIADLVSPGAGRVLETGRSVLKVVRVVAGVMRGHGVELAATVAAVGGIDLGLKLNVLARSHPARIRMAAEWSAIPADPEHRVNVEMDPGQVDHETKVGNIRLYQVDHLAEPVRARLIVGDFATAQLGIIASISAIAMSASMESVGTGHPYAPDEIVRRAAGFGLVEYDSGTRSWRSPMPNRDEKTPPVGSLIHLDPGRGFGSIIGLNPDGSAQITSVIDVVTLEDATIIKAESGGRPARTDQVGPWAVEPEGSGPGQDAGDEPRRLGEQDGSVESGHDGTRWDANRRSGHPWSGDGVASSADLQATAPNPSRGPVSPPKLVRLRARRPASGRLPILISATAVVVIWQLWRRRRQDPV